MITDYDTLKAACADFLLRDDLTTVIPTFIQLAEARMTRELRHYRQELRSLATLDAQYSTIPTDFLKPIRFQLTDTPTSELKAISQSQLLQMREDRADRAGRPTHYALTAGAFELYPTPDQAYAASLVYFGKVPALSDAAPTNWLLTEAPDAYLYGALIHSAPYLKDDPRLQVWETLYSLAIGGLNSNSEDAKWGGTGLVMKTRRGAP